MSPANVIFLFRLALGAAAILALWFGKAQYDASVRAPVERERDEARAAAESERKAKEWLNGVLVTQAERDTKVAKRLEGLANDLNALKQQSKEARDWAETRIPDDVVRVSGYAASGSKLPDPRSGAATGSGTDRPAAGSDQSGLADAEKQGAGGAGTMQQPTGLTGYLGQVWNRLQMKKPAEAGSK